MATAASPRSSSWIKSSSWLPWGLGAVVAAVVALLVIAAAGVFDSDNQSERRTAVARYIETVNTAQRSVAIELDRVNTVYLTLRRDPSTFGKRVPDLERGERALRSLSTRLRRVEPPVDARPLHRKVLRLTSLEVAFAHDLVVLGRFLPIFSAEQRQLATSVRRLGRELSASDGPEAQQRAFATYAHTLDRVARRLSGAAVPAALEPMRATVVERLRALETITHRIGRALDTQQTAGVATLVQGLVRMAGMGVTKAERDAISVFNAKLARIVENRAAVQKERARLDRSLR